MFIVCHNAFCHFVNKVLLLLLLLLHAIHSNRHVFIAVAQHLVGGRSEPGNSGRDGSWPSPIDPCRSLNGLHDLGLRIDDEGHENDSSSILLTRLTIVSHSSCQPVG